MRRDTPEDKDIIENGNILGSILSSINIEKGRLIELQNQTKGMEQKIESLQQTIRILKLSEKDTVMALSATKELFEAEKILQSKEKLKIQGFIADSNKILNGKTIIINELEKKYINLMVDLNNKYKIKELELEKQINDLGKHKEETIKINLSLENDIKEKKKSIERLKEDVVVLENKKSDMDRLVSCMLVDKRKIVEIELEIKNKQKEIENIVFDKQDVIDEIEKLKKDKEVIISEIKELEANKYDYIKQKIQMQDERAILNQQRDYIKSRYEQAGISF